VIKFAGRLLLLDIEGTTSALAFVHNVLFPYARRELAGYLERNIAALALRRALRRMAADARATSLRAWCPYPWPSPAAREWLIGEVYRLMDADAKQTGLKQLQGLIWQTGYRNGTLRSHVFPDVPARLRDWASAGIPVRIYSSGSVAAQKLFFAHTEAGDLTGLLSGYYDTTIGSKRESASYRAIAQDVQVTPEELLFLSDVPEELDAAQQAGLATGLVERPGNPPAPPTQHPRVYSFDEVVLERG
jgi:enolase-phosphatase E1